MLEKMMAEILLEREIKCLENNGIPKDQKFIYVLCQKELEIIKKIRTDNLFGTVDEVAERTKCQNIYLMEEEIYKSILEKTEKYDAILAIIGDNK